MYHLLEQPPAGFYALSLGLRQFWFESPCCLLLLLD